MTEFPLDSSPWGIAAGSDGNLWFTRGGQIGRITPAGTVTWFGSRLAPQEITAGPDGHLWFTEPGEGQIGRVTP